MFSKHYGSRVSLPTLDECYRKYSLAKLSAYNNCYKLVNTYADMMNHAIDNKGIHRILEDYGVISFTCNLFTFGAVINCHTNDFETEYFEYIVITKYNMYKIC